MAPLDSDFFKFLFVFASEYYVLLSLLFLYLQPASSLLGSRKHCSFTCNPKVSETSHEVGLKVRFSFSLLLQSHLH